MKVEKGDEERKRSILSEAKWERKMAGKRKKKPGIRNRDHQRVKGARRVQMMRRKQRMPLRKGDGFIDPHKETDGGIA